MLVVTISLVLLIVVSAMVLKMNLVTAAGIGTVAALFGGTTAYAVCYFVSPASAAMCATAGAISGMWASTLTFYFAQAQASAQGIHIGLLVGGGTG